MSIRGVVCATALLLATAVPALAQQPAAVDLAVGYQFTRALGSDGASGANIPAGWTASITSHLKPALNVVVEINGAYKDSARSHNYLAGLRIGGGHPDGTNEAIVFGQILTGLSRSSGSNAFVIQPGVGLDIRGSGRLSTRINSDYLLTRADEQMNKGFRVAVSLVFDLNRR